MHEIGTTVRYHGSIEALHGEIFTVVRHCCEGTRHVLDGPAIDGLGLLRHVRHASITPLGQTAPRADLERAIADQRPVMITYVASGGEWTTRTIEPYELVVTGAGRVIVRAMDHRSGEPRSFRLDRIHAADLMPGSFRLERATPDQARAERAALARLRAEIAHVAPDGLGEARWTPGFPVL